jgi:hypothetical protein
MMAGMNATATDLAACAEQVEAYFSGVLTHVAELDRTLTETMAQPEVTSADVVAAIKESALAILSGPLDVVGAGFVAAPDVLADHDLYMAWWQGDDRALLGAPETDPITAEPADYTRRPWFRVPAETRAAHFTGPYVDFVCTGDYVITTTTPVIASDRMVGVVGVDILVESLEASLLPVLRRAGASLVNEHGRAVVSADPHVGPGDRIARTGRRLACRGLPFAVVSPA